MRAQFAKPAGVSGWVVGRMMSLTNRGRSEWVFSLLELESKERVLEIGFGTGTDIDRASKTCQFVAGVDHSEMMVGAAKRRNSRAIAEGRVDLKLASAHQLPFPDGHFDKVFTINCAQFWKNAEGAFVEIRRILKPGGLAAIAVEPRNKGATEDTARQVGATLTKALNKAGFTDVHGEFRIPRPAVCLLAR